MAVLISAKNDAQFSSSFFHLKNSSFESLSNSAAMLAGFCVTPAPAGKVKKMRAYSRLLSQVTFAVVDVVFTRCPQSSFPSVLVAVSLSSRRSPSDTRRETLYRHVWSMLTRVID